MSYMPPKARHLPPQGRFTGSLRGSLKPGVLHVIHICGNPRTARDADGVENGSGAHDEYSHASKPGRDVSANDYIARNGSYIEYLDPKRYVAWSNGVLRRPMTQLPGVRYLVGLRRRGIGPNAGCYRMTESVGTPGSHPLTPEQRETIAYLIARDSIDTDTPITPFETVLTHAHLNPVNRSNCAFPPAERDAAVRAVCARANQIKALLQGKPAPAPKPTPRPKPTPAPAPAGGEDVATKGYDPANPQIVDVDAGAPLYERIGGPSVGTASAPPSLAGRDWLGESSDGTMTLISSGGDLAKGTRWVPTGKVKNRRPKPVAKAQLDAAFLRGRDAAAKAAGAVQP